MLDFSVARLPATAAEGNVTFSRFGSTSQASVPVGCLVKTNDGSQTFSVGLDAANPSWSSSSNAYLIPIAVSSVTVPVTALIPGAQGNVQAGVVSMIASALPGVDTVTNADAFVAGCNSETDAALRSRFQNFLASRSRATPSAVAYAIASLKQGLNYVVQENVDASGASMPGSFVITIDDGSGYPPASLLASVASAVDTVRPIGSVFAVQPPLVTLAAVSFNITLTRSDQRTSAISSITAAVAQYIDGLGIGAPLSATRIAQTIYRSAHTVSNVASVSINEQAQDLFPPINGVIKSGTISVN
jgi:uncharacterized phage protein gp47/JayE